MTGMSMQALLDAHPRDYGVSETGGMVVYVEPGEGKTDAIGLTYNTESIYASMSLDLKQRVSQNWLAWKYKQVSW